MVEHVNIPDADRHEPKGASTAATGQFLSANGDGTTTFTYINYGDIVNLPTPAGYRHVLSGASIAASQLPTALDTPLQIEFGAAQSVSGASLSAAGALTITEPGDYLISLFFRFGRTTAAGVSVMLNRILINGTQVLNSTGYKLPSADYVIPFSATIPVTVDSVPAVFTSQIVRDSGGVNDGGLYRLTPTAVAWNPAPSATIAVSKYVGTL